MGTVFNNHKTTTPPTRNNFLRQSKPNATPNIWRPNRPVFSLRQPHEKGSFFSVSSNGPHGNNGVNE